jgi:hypothetical protein
MAVVSVFVARAPAPRVFSYFFNEGGLSKGNPPISNYSG